MNSSRIFHVSIGVLTVLALTTQSSLAAVSFPDLGGIDWSKWPFNRSSSSSSQQSSSVSSSSSTVSSSVSSVPSSNSSSVSSVSSSSVSSSSSSSRFSFPTFRTRFPRNNFPWFSSSSVASSVSSSSYSSSTVSSSISSGPSSSSSSSSDDTLHSIRQEIVQLVNSERAQLGLQPLRDDADLHSTAQHHAEDMYNRQYFSHISPEGTNVTDRIRASGYRLFGSWSTGENIAKGQRSAEAVMDDWMNSPGHRGNILSNNFTEIGIGFYENTWVQVFARP